MGGIELPQPGEGSFQRAPHPSKRCGPLLGELIVENADGSAMKAKIARHPLCIAPRRSHAQRCALRESTCRTCAITDSLKKILECLAVQIGRCPLSKGGERTNHDDHETGDCGARDRRAGGSTLCCGSEEAQASQAPYSDSASRNLWDVWNIGDATPNLWDIRKFCRNRHRSVGRIVQLAVGRRDQLSPHLEQHESGRSQVTGRSARPTAGCELSIRCGPGGLAFLDGAR